MHKGFLAKTKSWRQRSITDKYVTGLLKYSLFIQPEQIACQGGLYPQTHKKKENPQTLQSLREVLKIWRSVQERHQPVRKRTKRPQASQEELLMQRLETALTTVASPVAALCHIGKDNTAVENKQVTWQLGYCHTRDCETKWSADLRSAEIKINTHYHECLWRQHHALRRPPKTCGGSG